MRTNAVLLIFLFFLITGIGFSEEKNKDDIITLRINAPESGLIKGRSNIVHLEIEIKRLYHINSEQPQGDYLIPVSLSFDDKEGIKINKITFPKPVFKKFSFSDSPLSIYEGSVTLTIDVAVGAIYKKKEVILSGTFHYQACDEESCLPPTDLPFEFILKIK